MALIYDSSHSGQEIDAAVDAVQTTIPSQLTQIGSKLDEKADILVTAEPFDTTTLTQIGGANITGSNVWTTSTTQYGSFIEVNGGERIRVTANASYPFQYAFLTSRNWSSGGTPDFVSGYAAKITQTKGTTSTITIPSGCTYLWIFNKTTSASYLPSSFYFIDRNMVESNREEIEKVEVIATEADGTLYGNYYIRADGTLYASATWELLTFQNNGVERLEAYLGSYHSVPYIIGFYSSTEMNPSTFISGIATTDEIANGASATVYKGVIPSGCVTIAVTNRTSSLASASKWVKIYSTLKDIIAYNGSQDARIAENEADIAVLEVSAKKADALTDKVVYQQNPNLLDPSTWEQGRLVYNSESGNKGTNVDSTQHVRINDYIELDPSIGVSVQTKAITYDGQRLAIDVFTFDENKTWIGGCSSSASDHEFATIYGTLGDDYTYSGNMASGNSAFCHIKNGARYIRVFVRYFLNDFSLDDYVPEVMIWQTDSKVMGTYYPYGETSDFYIDGLVSSRGGSSIEQYDGQVMNIAYSSLVNGYPINTKEHFLHAVSLGYNGIKGDMRLTSDGGIVLCHDAGFTLDSNGRITTFDSSNCTLIHDMTLAQCLALEHANAAGYQTLGYYAHPCTLDDMLLICKEYGIVPYITFRWEYYEETAAKMYQSLQKYGLASKAIINLYNSLDAVSHIRALDKGIILCDTIDAYSRTSTDLATQIDTASSLNCSILCLNSVDIADYVTDEIVQYAASKGIRLYAWGVNAYNNYYSYIGMGLRGFQITSDIGLKCLTPAAITMRLNQ